VLTLDIEPGHIYSYKVEAFNAGGRSFPSEILSVGAPVGSKRSPVLIVNNFDRISAPAWIDTPDYAGFESRIDSGVPYMSEIGYIGENYEFRRAAPFGDNEYPGFGASFDDQAGFVFAGNTFDYPYRHGVLLMHLGYPFYSMSRDAFTANEVPAYVIDLICGKQGRTTIGRGAVPERFAVWPEALQSALRRQVKAGARLLVSGANIASDSPDDAAFLEELLGIKLANPFGTNSGELAGMPFSQHMNEEIYSVERPDGMRPVGKGARVWLTYPGRQYAAAVINQTENSSSVAIGVPIETLLHAADREWVLQEALDFLYNGKEPANRK